MKTTWFTGAAMAAALVVGPALAANPIYTGGQSGSYFGSFGPLLLDVLKKEFFDYELKTSAGSGENIEQVLSNPQAIGMTQTDVLAFKSAQNPAIADKISIIRNDVTNECLYAVTTEANQDRLTNWGAVAGYARRVRFALGPQDSGSAQTFQLLQSFDERLAEASKVSYLDSTDAAIDAVINGQADVAFFVQFPDPSNARFERLNDAKMVFVPVVDRNILRQRFADGERAYVPLEVKVTSAGLLNWQGVEKIVTACTPLAYITGNPDMLPEGSTERLDQEEMIKIVREVPVSELQPQAGWFQSMLDDLAQVSEQGLEKALQAVDDARESIAQ
ncbi:TAXI family TRAP transporter solute-binding subunit [Roseospira navarrensis]|nr:TAXI family TRAP transporter solute-binding subunit [Roseospira navarrensis]